MFHQIFRVDIVRYINAFLPATITLSFGFHRRLSESQVFHQDSTACHLVFGDLSRTYAVSIF